MPIEFEISKRQLIFLTILIIIIIAAIVAVAFFFIRTVPNWVSVASWNGNETEYTVTTQPFSVNGTEWRVSWEVSGYDNSSRCYISVFDAGTKVLIMEIPHEQQSGETHFDTNGTFYLVISLHGQLNSWSVQVYQTT